MSVTITGGGVTATVALRGAMTTAVFDLGDRLVSPLYAWRDPDPVSTTHPPHG